MLKILWLWALRPFLLVVLGQAFFQIAHGLEWYPDRWIADAVLGISGEEWGNTVAWVIAAVFSAIALWFFEIRRSRKPDAQTVSADISETELTVDDWQQEWHELRFRRNDFWSLINRAYDHWKPSEHQLQEIISKAQIPSALPLDDKSAFPQWVWQVKDLQSDRWSVALNEFAKAIYDDSRSNQPTLVFGGSTEFDRFDGIRRELSKFWDHWGRQNDLDRLINDQNIENVIQSSIAELKLLTFLEIARARWNPTGATGKSGLFALAKKSSPSLSCEPQSERPIPVPNDSTEKVSLVHVIVRTAGHSWDTRMAKDSVDALDLPDQGTSRSENAIRTAWSHLHDQARSGHLCISGRKQFPDADLAARSGPLEIIDADYWSNATIHPGESDWGIEAPDIVETSPLEDQSGFVPYADLQIDKKDAVRQMLDSFYKRGVRLRDEFGWRMKERNERWTSNVQSFFDQELPGFALLFSRATDEIPLPQRQVEPVMMKQRFKVFRELMESAEQQPERIENQVVSYNQSGGITAHTVNVDTDKPRQLTAELKVDLLQNLPNDRPVKVFGMNGNTESLGFANQIYSALKEGGYSMKDDSAVWHMFFNSPVFDIKISEGEGGKEWWIVVGSAK